MGRYYNGDIDGKFWFAVQSSDDAEFFGVTGETPNYLEYYFDEENLEEIKQGISECLKQLGEYKEKLDYFFKENNGYNDEMIVTSLEIEKDKVKTLLEWYARLELGEKILKCVEENGTCHFEAEC